MPPCGQILAREWRNYSQSSILGGGAASGGAAGASVGAGAGGGIDGLAKAGGSARPLECGTPASYPFFISFTILVSYLILNLFIAVIFESFDESAQKDETFAEVVNLSFKRWREFDPDCRCFLPLREALEFINSVIEEVGDALMDAEFRRNKVVATFVLRFCLFDDHDRC